MEATTKKPRATRKSKVMVFRAPAASAITPPSPPATLCGTWVVEIRGLQAPDSVAEVRRDNDTWQKYAATAVYQLTGGTGVASDPSESFSVVSYNPKARWLTVELAPGSHTMVTRSLVDESEIAEADRKFHPSAQRVRGSMGSAEAQRRLEEAHRHAIEESRASRFGSRY